MRRFLRVALLLLLLPATASARDDGAATGDDPVARARAAVTTLEKDFAAARAEMRERVLAMQEGEAYQEALEARDYETITKLNEEITGPVMEHWRGVFAEAAAPFDGTEGEVIFATAIIEANLSKDLPAELLGALGGFPGSAHLAALLEFSPFLVRMGRRADLDAALGKVIEENPSEEIRAYAHFARARAVAYDSQATDEDRVRAEADNAAVLRLVPEDHIIALRARGPKFEKTRLQIGMTAPDIEGVDLDGVAFRLSDYRGKVVMLDFWGDW